MGFLAAVACATTPYTRRSQLILISAEQETKLGAQAYQEVLAKSRIERSSAVVQPIEAVGQRIARVVNRPDFHWQFTVINDPKQQNAFALPGGKVAVYTGILPVAQTTAGLAVVLGHEIGHVVARHGAERMSQGLVAQVGGSMLGALLGGGPSANMVLAAYGLGAQLGVLLPFSRTQESEADHIGLVYMARAGYNPREAVAFWKRMVRASKGKEPPEFASDHPSDKHRVERIKEWLPEAEHAYKPAR